MIRFNIGVILWSLEKGSGVSMLEPALGDPSKGVASVFWRGEQQ